MFHTWYAISFDPLFYFTATEDLGSLRKSNIDKYDLRINTYNNIYLSSHLCTKLCEPHEPPLTSLVISFALQNAVPWYLFSKRSRYTNYDIDRLHTTIMVRNDEYSRIES